MRSANSRWSACGYGSSRNGASICGACWTSSLRTGLIVSKTSATSVVFMNGSKSSRSGVYGESSHSKHST